MPGKQVEQPDSPRPPSPEPWWARHLGFAAVAVVTLIAVLVSGNPFPLAAVVTAYTALLRAGRPTR